MKRRGRASLLFAVIFLVSAACGQRGASDNPGEENAVQTESDAGQTEDRAAYWTQAQWIHKGDIKSISMHPLYLTEEVRDLAPEPDQAYDDRSVRYCTLGNAVYGLEEFYRQKGEVWERSYYLSRYDGTEGGITHRPVELPSPEEYGAEEFLAAAFDVKEEQELVVFLQGRQEESPGACYLAVHMTPEGEIVSVRDLYPAMRELGVNLGEYYEKAYVDGNGYYYLISGQASFSRGNRVSVLSPEGTSVREVEAGDYYTGVEWAMKLPDGSPVFAWGDQGRMFIRLETYDAEENTSRVLLENRLPDAWMWTPAADGYLYYVNGEGELTRCDIRTGTVEECLHFPQLGLEGGKRSPYAAGLLIGERGEPEILGCKDGEPVICRLSTEKPETGELRVVCNGWFSDYIKDCAASFSRKDADYSVLMEYPEESEEAYWDRTMAELVSGRGADLYYVSLSELQTLQEKGALADLRELLSKETLAAVWPGVLERGTWGGQLVGIMPEAWADTVIVADEIWAGDHWTLEEALEVIEAHPEFRYPVVSGGSLRRDNVMEFLVTRNLAESPFLNLEEGTCSFDTPLFIRALELAGTYPESFPIEESQEMYQEKDWVAAVCMVNISFTDNYKGILGETYHAVGYPTEGGEGTFWRTGQFLAVNREAKHPEQAAAFLEELLSYDRQCTSHVPVRRDMLDNRLREHVINGKREMCIEYGDGTMTAISPGPKGDYRIGEHTALMEECLGITADTAAIEDIIWEEAADYFSGSRDAETVARAIQSRVQVYLKEQT